LVEGTSFSLQREQNVFSVAKNFQTVSTIFLSLPSFFILRGRVYPLVAKVEITASLRSLPSTKNLFLLQLSVVALNPQAKGSYQQRTRVGFLFRQRSGAIKSYSRT